MDYFIANKKDDVLYYITSPEPKKIFEINQKEKEINSRW